MLPSDDHWEFRRIDFPKNLWIGEILLEVTMVLFPVVVL
jgi:hypothetical protein